MVNGDPRTFFSRNRVFVIPNKNCQKHNNNKIENRVNNIIHEKCVINCSLKTKTKIFKLRFIADGEKLNKNRSNEKSSEQVSTK